MTMGDRSMASWLDRAVAWLEKKQAELAPKAAEGQRRLDEAAQRRGYPDWRTMKTHRALKKHGYWWCPACETNVRPQAPWGFVRLATLSLAQPGKRECPRCRGTLFAPPRPF